MKTYSEVCPICGTLNENLYLQETEGNYECQCCKSNVKSLTFGMQYESLPLFDLAKPEDHSRLLKFLGIKQKVNNAL